MRSKVSKLLRLTQALLLKQSKKLPPSATRLIFRHRKQVWICCLSLAGVLLIGLFFTIQQRENTDFDEFEEESSMGYGSLSSSRSTSYSSNSRDRAIFLEFESHHSVATRVGRGSNSLEILLGAVDSMNWSQASSQLKQAVREMKSIKNGDSSTTRNRKMERFVEIYNFY